MGNRITALAAALACLAACDDPIFVIGDPPGVMRVVAGIADSAGSLLTARAKESRLQSPGGLTAVDGMAYVSDAGNSRVLRVSSSGEIELLADAGTSGPGSGLQRPEGLALDPDGRLIIADSRAHRLWRLSPETGELEAIAGTGTQGNAPDTVLAVTADLAAPTGVTLDADGRIYFSEFAGHRVRRLDPDGTLITFAGNGDFGAAGDDGPAHRAELARPAGLSAGGGNLYIADSGNHRIRRVELQSRIISTMAGAGVRGFGGDGGPATRALLDTPLAVAISASGRVLFIADAENHRVRSVDLVSGRIDTFAGTGDMAFAGDLRPAAETALHSPAGLTVSPIELLFISDTGHHIVWRTAVSFLAAP